MLLLGSLYSRSFLSPEYLLQQPKVALFPRRDRHRHDDRHPARPDRPLRPLGGRRRRYDVHRGDGMGSGRRSDGNSVRGRVRSGPGPPQRLRRRLSANPVDDHHARGQRGRPRVDGGPHRGLLAAGFIVPGDAHARHWRFFLFGLPNALLVWAVVGAGATSSLGPHHLLYVPSTASAPGSAPPIFRRHRHPGAWF